MTDAPFVARDLSISFKKNQVLRGLDLTLHAGETTVLIGENGAGKSTLMQLALGTLRPSGRQHPALRHGPGQEADPDPPAHRLRAVGPGLLPVDELCRT